MAKPLGIVFWCLGLVCLCAGFGNYIKTVTKYSRRMALVQTGWKTQVASFCPEKVLSYQTNKGQVFGIVAASIVGVCILLLATHTRTDSG